VDEKVLLFMVLCNGPLAWVIVADRVESRRSEGRAQAALATNRCQAGSWWLPGSRCGQPVVARLDLYEGYEYRFFKWLCEDHAEEAHRRSRGPSYRIDRLSPRAP
jgi:hypothetical protein